MAQDMMPRNFSQRMLALVVVVIVGLLAYSYLTMPDHRTFGDRVGDAFDTLPQGIDKASEKLEDRTPGQKLGDHIKDAGQRLKDNTAPDQ